MKNLVLRVLPPLIPFVLFVLVAEFLVQKNIVPSYILPAPSSVYESLNTDFAEYRGALTDTLGAAFVGLTAACIAGVASALLLSSSDWTERALYPYATFFQTVPIVSIAPLLVIWFGFGFKTVAISAFIVSIFPIIANTLAGLKFTDPALLDLFKLYGAGGFKTLFKLRLPFAVPQILVGIKISAGLSMIGAIIGEFIAGGGLGGVIDTARTQQRLDKVFAAILLASLSGILLVYLINLITKLFLHRWRELK